MSAIDGLIKVSGEVRKRIAVLGCSMTDRWVHGELQPSQDGVQKFVEQLSLTTPGGAAGAARQLCRWNADVALISLVKPEASEAWNQVSSEYILECRRMPTKTRFLDDSGCILWRHDLDNGYGLDANGLTEARRLALLAIREGRWDAVLIADYDKGFVDNALVQVVIEACQKRGVPVVADAKREPWVYEGAILKGNDAYRLAYPRETIWRFAGTVFTRGESSPVIGGDEPKSFPYMPPVRLVSHVGAGDCFGAHLALALAHGFPLEDAARIAHSAGRVYVQHAHGRPPYPCEIQEDMQNGEN